jgi:hypothetical protein
MKVRVGIPKTGGALVKAARERGYPVLFSANAFATVEQRGEREGAFRRFNLPDPEQFAGLDAALDSAGFVAAVRYGDYRWSVESYYDLVQAHDWTWHASMDYCCEPEIAKDRPLRLLRIAATANMLAKCMKEADRRLVKPPMPVLQGWLPDEYALCAGMLPLTRWPDLVGLGSVCRRPVHGPNGILAIIEAIDGLLPPHTKLHLFGVKSAALEQVAGHPRVASMDSMAWDFSARALRRTGRSMNFRIGVMEGWVRKQLQIVSTVERSREPVGISGMQTMLFDPSDFGGHFEDHEELVLEALTWPYVDLVAGGELEYRDALYQLRYDAVTAIGMMRCGRFYAEGPACFDELVAGVSEHFERMLAQGVVPGAPVGRPPGTGAAAHTAADVDSACDQPVGEETRDTFRERVTA